jgi:polyphosphate kinase 2 (PPK2 family)
MGFAKPEEVARFYEDCRVVEGLWVSDNIHLIKFWLDVSRTEQARRFKERASNPLKLGKLSPIDLVSQTMWDEYSLAENDILRYFNEPTPWVKVKSDCKRSARIATMQYVLLNNYYAGQNLDNIGDVDPTILTVQKDFGPWLKRTS